MLFVVSAPSGSGKTTIVKETLKNNTNIVFSVSATTRIKREEEVDGKDYYFISIEEFRQKIKNGEFIEYEQIFDGNYYGTLKKYADDSLKENKDMLLDLDVLGALSVRKYYPDDSVLIFIKPPDKETVKSRLKNRSTESEEQINRRLARYEIEMAKIKEFDYIIENIKLENAIFELQNIIDNYKKNKI